MNKRIIFFLLATVTSLALAEQAAYQSPAKTRYDKPLIQHGVDYQAVSNIREYYVSEKLDGVRGYWNGEQLLTRKGHVIHTPDWFTHHWPTMAVDGELWIDRDNFQPLLSCVRKQVPDENKTTSCWRHVRFMMFDLPHHQGDFSQRVAKMSALLLQTPSLYFCMVSQNKVDSLDALEHKLSQVMAMQGEGLMLHFGKAHYQTGRTTALMKLKKHQDAEAVVIAYTQGKGKYQDKMGAVHVKLANGIMFKIGSGFTDHQRANPPEIGSVITFKYNGLTDSGIPRFARFWRVKEQLISQVDK